MKRRSFLMSSAAAATPLMAQSADRVPTAMIGTGNRGSYVLQGVLEQPVAKVVALCDIKADRLDKAATLAAKDNPKTYKEWRQIIDRKDIDVVYIATPPHLHAEMAVAALKAGKHVYCEKPIGVTAAQVRDVVKAAKASSKVFVAGQQLRSHKQLTQAINQIRQGAIGDIVMVKAQRHASGDLNHEGSSADWYFDVTKSGGYLIEQSVHNLDLCNWVIGAHPVKATGFGAIALHKNDPPGRTIFDCGSITYEYPSGIFMSFTQNVFHPRGLPGANQLVYVYGSKGAVDLLYSTNMYPLQSQGTPAPKPLAEPQKEPPHAHTTAFYESILKGQPSPADITIGASAALTAILGHEAMVKQNTVKWSDFGITL
jgi:predicted dehydrogenase